MEKAHWTQEKEVGGALPLLLTLWMVRILPSWVLRLLAIPISFCYYLFIPKTRSYCRIYQEQLIAFGKARNSTDTPKKVHIYKQIHAFALAIIEKVQGWSGKIFLKTVHFQDDDVQELITILEKKQGVLVITSHLGNVEMLRSLMGFDRTAVNRRFPVVTIGNVKTTQKFNTMLGHINPGYDMSMITSDTIGPGTIIQLQEKLEQGAMVVIAGDRTSEATKDRVIPHSFLGKNASFPYGVYFLAALLHVPVYFVFGLRKNDTALALEYEMHVHKSKTEMCGPRSERENRITELSSEFVAYLESYCVKHPYQWYNFYDFWTEQ